MNRHELHVALTIGGRLVLPVIFGLRRGVLVGRVDFEPAGDGARLVWQLEESHLELQRASVAPGLACNSPIASACTSASRTACA